MSDLISIIGIVLSTLLGVISLVLTLQNKAEVKRVRNEISNRSSVAGGVHAAGFVGCSDVKDSKAEVHYMEKKN